MQSQCNISICDPFLELQQLTTDKNSPIVSSLNTMYDQTSQLTQGSTISSTIDSSPVFCELMQNDTKVMPTKVLQPTSLKQPNAAKRFRNTNPPACMKHVPHREKPPQIVEKRNARERRRVQAVNSAFTNLRKSIPLENRNKRVSKVKTLHKAIEYISALQKLLQNLDQQEQQITNNTEVQAMNVACDPTYVQEDQSQYTTQYYSNSGCSSMPSSASSSCSSLSPYYIVNDVSHTTYTTSGNSPSCASSFCYNS